MIDLAAGARVDVRRNEAGDAAGQHQWNDRCAALFGLRHPHLLPLIDYGLLGSASRFEAYRSGGKPWRRRDAATAAALRNVVQFLHERGLRCGELSWRTIVDGEGRPVLMPVASTGLPLGGRERAVEQQELAALFREGADSAFTPEAAGETLQAPSVLPRLLELLESGRPGGWRSISVPAGSPAEDEALVSILAREARLRGYVPVALSVLTGSRRLADALLDHHLLLIVRQDSEELDRSAAAVDAMLAVALRNTRPSLVLRIGRSSGRTTSPIDTPGRLLATPVGHSGWVAGGGRVVREVVPAYGRTATGGLVQPAVDAPSQEQAEPDVDGLWRAARRGFTLRDRGLHAAAERALRGVVGAFARRGNHDAAGQTASDLGRLLLERGRVSEAVSAFEHARSSFQRAGCAPAVAQSAIFIALAWTDDGRLVEAGAALRSVQIVAAGLSDREIDVAARAALARCLCWQARYAEAETVLEGSHPERPELATIMIALAARVALGRGELALAGAQASAALERAEALRQSLLVASACGTIAAVQGAIGDLDAVRRYVTRGVGAARLAHAPIRALRLRVTELEAYNRLHRRREARVIAARLSRYPLAKLPALLRMRVQIALANAGVGERSLEEVRAAARTCGVHALSETPAPAVELDTARDLIELLEICQESDPGHPALERVMSAVRDRSGAASVALLDRDASTLVFVGGRSTSCPSSARRALQTGLCIPPADEGSGLEAAAPIRFMGETIGVLVCRWTEPRMTGSRAAGLLMTAAAASAPMLHAALEARLRARSTSDPTGPEIQGDLIGIGSTIDEVRRLIRRAAVAPFPVMIEGESGSGKELVARAIHRASGRRSRKFAAVNCAALAEDLIEAELFGHARGAFTGAVAERAGLFEEADGGTLLLDEAGDLSPRAQAKLLRVLQEGEVRRVGETFARRVDVRIVAATNRSLRTEVAAGRFREDLLYRLDVIHITVPALRDRPEDVPILARHFWARALVQTSGHAALTEEVIGALARYDWPGNVRELQNVLAALAVRAAGQRRVGLEWLPEAISGAGAVPVSTLEEARQAFERRFVRAALARAGGHRGRAATELGLSRQGLVKLLNRLNLS